MNFSIKQLICIRNKAINKMIWCVWGHDLYFKYKSIKEKIKKVIRKEKLKYLYGVGIGFKFDALEVREVVGKNPKIFYLPYGYEKGSDQKYLKVVQDSQKDKEYYRIMIGHSGFEFLNHIELMKKLLKYKNDNLKISLVLAYGIPEYIEKVKKFAKENFDNDKIEIIDQFMDEIEYLKYLNTVDVAIFDHKHQAALGNIWKLSYLGKKIFLNQDGIIKMAFNLEALESYNVKDIDKMEYNDFVSDIETKEKKKLQYYGKSCISEQVILKAWKKLFMFLENE